MAALPFGFAGISWPDSGPPPIHAPFTLKPLPDRNLRTAMIQPVLRVTRVANTFNRTFWDHRHTGTDIVAPKMTPVVAPFSGTLGFKVETFWIYGNNGYFCLGTHLNDDTPGTNDNSHQIDFMFAPGLRSGQLIRQGTLIGYVGDSGWATGPHLHFEIFDKNFRLVNSYWSVMAAMKISSPVVELAPYPRPPKNQLRIDGFVRGYNGAKGILTVIARTRQVSSGGARTISTPTYYRFKNVYQSRLNRNDGVTVYFKPTADRAGWCLRFERWLQE